MKPYFSFAGATLYLGDCREIMRALPEASVDSIVCDPPYGLEFMGKQWDSFRSDDRDVPGYNGRKSGVAGEAAGSGDGTHAARRNRAVAYGGGKRAMTSRCEGCGKRDQFRKPHACPQDTNWRTEIVDPYSAPPTMLAFQNWSREWAIEALRVAKPGAHLVAFGGTRTFHRLTCALEDAGWEIRDCLSWLYGSGFPKSLDVSKAIDKAAGAEREVVGQRTDGCGNTAASLHKSDGFAASRAPVFNVTAPATDLARQWNGWGTALKPAWEPIILARKPLVGTVAQNVEQYGTGAINVDGCRLAASGEAQTQGAFSGSTAVPYAGARDAGKTYAATLGRWPANVVLDEEAAQMLDEQSGELIHDAGSARTTEQGTHSGVRADGWGNMGGPAPRFGDSGGASRFFYTAKASRSEREAGLSGQTTFMATMGDGIGAREHNPDQPSAHVRNFHPTVKPIDLMRWLVRLTTRRGGLVLDPFSGSGSTLLAARLEGCDSIGLEQSPEYIEIARGRLNVPVQEMLL